MSLTPTRGECAEFRRAMRPGGVFSRTSKLYICGCACWTSKVKLPPYQLFAQSPTHSVYHFSKKNTLFLLKLGVFPHNLLKLRPIYVIWITLSLMKTHRSLYQISRNSTPNKSAKRQPYINAMSMCSFSKSQVKIYVLQ